MARGIMKETTRQNKSYFTIKEKEQLINDTKQTIISLAYTDYLTPYDLDELSQILSTISLYRVRKNEGNK